MTQRYGSTICHRVERIIVLYFGQEFLQASSMRASKVARFVCVSDDGERAFLYVFQWLQ